MWRNGIRIGCAVAACVAAVAVLYLDRGQQPMLASVTPHRPLAATVVGPSGRTLAQGGWSGAAHLVLRVAIAGEAAPRRLAPEVELLPFTQPFTGLPNMAGALVPVGAHARRDAVIRVAGLHDGASYHWRARVRDQDGSAGPWIAGSAFRVSTLAPRAPRLTSANVAEGSLTNVATASIHWDRPAVRAGIAYYQWAVSPSPDEAPTWHRTMSTALHLHALPTGTWYIRVRAMDRAGNPSAPLRWSVRIDRTLPAVNNLAASAAGLTPGAEALHLQFNLAKPAAVTLSAFRVGSLAAPAFSDLGSMAAGYHDVAWRGLDGMGRPLASGNYRLVVEAHDAIGNTGRAALSGITVDSRRIVVSLSKQDLTVFDGSHVLLHTPITSGGPETRTPVGTFHILARYAPYLMRSPWPRSSRLWYPDSRVNYALLFLDGGYFLHDAPWRTIYGPGSNAVDGIPGGNTTGTHGCVNVPYAAERWLYQWATVGTSVQINS